MEVTLAIADRDSPAASLLGYMIDTFVDAAAVSDHSIRRMSDRILLSRVHRMFEESRWLLDIAKPIAGLNDAARAGSGRPSGVRPQHSYLLFV